MSRRESKAPAQFAQYQAIKELERRIAQLHRWIGCGVPREQLDVLAALCDRLLADCGGSLVAAGKRDEINGLKTIIEKQPTIRIIK